MMDNYLSNLKILKTTSGYSSHFMDADLWAPVIQKICLEHAIIPTNIHPGTAGTFPTFILDRKYVIKFFGPLFNGSHSFQIELAVGSLLASQPGFPAVRILTSGSISTDRDTWQYILFNYIPGQSYGEDVEQITYADRQAVAFQLGEMLRVFHCLLIPESLAKLFPIDPAVYHARLEGWFLARSACPQQQSFAGLGLPSKLALQAVDYLQNFQENVQYPSPLHLIQADMTRDHVLGDFVQGHWQINGLIDFGDCMTGDLFYELAPLHLDFFDCDKSLLTKFMAGYQAQGFPSEGFARQCLCAALQHQFNVFSGVFERHPELAEIENLDQLAKALWEND